MQDVDKQTITCSDSIHFSFLVGGIMFLVYQLNGSYNF